MDYTLGLYLMAAYLLGAIPFGVVVAKILGGRDPRSAGSKNIGATNVARVLGKKAGALTLFLDAAKGFLPVFLAAALFKGELAPALAGLAAFLGHLFPVYLKFKGGKGIATGAGVFLALSPVGLAVSVAVFAAAAALWRMVSLASILSSMIFPLAAYLLKEPRDTVFLGAVVALLAIYKHKENIVRIINGTESKLGERA